MNDPQKIPIPFFFAPVYYVTLNRQEIYEHDDENTIRVF